LFAELLFATSSHKDMNDIRFAISACAFPCSASFHDRMENVPKMTTEIAPNTCRNHSRTR
jgi:hypothetical protein